MNEMTFKFRFLNDQGHEQSMFAKRGSFDGESLQLDDVSLPAAAIAHVDIRGNRMMMSVMAEEPQMVAISVAKGDAAELMLMLGRARSAAWCRIHKEKLEQEGRGHEFRQEQCPHCGAMLDLTGMPQSPQVSCEFCHALGTLPGSNVDAPPNEKHFRLCDECGMYSRPRQFTIFYFYFLFVVYGWSSRTTWRCPGCMRGEAWKMFFGNLLFVLGVPVALVQLFRAYGGADMASDDFPGLDSANLKARQGRCRDAIAAYQGILTKRRISAGVKYNLGLAFLADRDVEDAAAAFQFALSDCANYQPAAAAMARCLEELGRDEELAELKKQWGADGDDAEELEEDYEGGHFGEPTN